jgi:hypothetical protein
MVGAETRPGSTGPRQTSRASRSSLGRIRTGSGGPAARQFLEGERVELVRLDVDPVAGLAVDDLPRAGSRPEVVTIHAERLAQRPDQYLDHFVRRPWWLVVFPQRRDECLHRHRAVGVAEQRS